jgi:hypothetical protein
MARQGAGAVPDIKTVSCVGPACPEAAAGYGSASLNLCSCTPPALEFSAPSSCNAMPRHALPCHITPCPALSPCVMPCHAVPCCAMPCHAVPCRAMLCHAVPCRAMLCHAVPCCAMLCHAVPCRACFAGKNVITLELHSRLMSLRLKEYSERCLAPPPQPPLSMPGETATSPPHRAQPAGQQPPQGTEAEGGAGGSGPVGPGERAAVLSTLRRELAGLGAPATLWELHSMHSAGTAAGAGVPPGGGGEGRPAKRPRGQRAQHAERAVVPVVQTQRLGISQCNIERFPNPVPQLRHMAEACGLLAGAEHIEQFQQGAEADPAAAAPAAPAPDQQQQQHPGEAGGGPAAPLLFPPTSWREAALSLAPAAAPPGPGGSWEGAVRWQAALNLPALNSTSCHEGPGAPRTTADGAVEGGGSTEAGAGSSLPPLFGDASRGRSVFWWAGHCLGLPCHVAFPCGLVARCCSSSGSSLGPPCHVAFPCGLVARCCFCSGPSEMFKVLLAPPHHSAPPVQTLGTLFVLYPPFHPAGPGLACRALGYGVVLAEALRLAMEGGVGPRGGSQVGSQAGSRLRRRAWLCHFSQRRHASPLMWGGQRRRTREQALAASQERTVQAFEATGMWAQGAPDPRTNQVLEVLREQWHEGQQ